MPISSIYSIYLVADDVATLLIWWIGNLYDHDHDDMNDGHFERVKSNGIRFFVIFSVDILMYHHWHQFELTGHSPLIFFAFRIVYLYFTFRRLSLFKLIVNINVFVIRLVFTSV